LPFSVSVETAATGDIAQSLPVSGSLGGENEAVVVSETNGRIVEVRAQVGDWLEKGQVILQVENDLKAVALEQARAHLLAAQTNHDKAQKDLAR
jgi:multidrug efflux pump subunit AcrA (membrane-fusion protein)